MLTISALKYVDYDSDDEPFGAGGEASEPQKMGYAQLFSDVTEAFRKTVPIKMSGR